MRQCADMVQVGMADEDVLNFKLFFLIQHQTDSSRVNQHGFIITTQSKSFAYSADTGPTEAFWEAVSDAPNLRGLMVEVSFPNRLQKLAEVTGHLTPDSLKAELNKARRQLNVPIVAFHVKPEYEKEIRKELKASKIPGVEVAQTNKIYNF